jgi:AraC family transcriptional regulator
MSSQVHYRSHTAVDRVVPALLPAPHRTRAVPRNYELHKRCVERVILAMSRQLDLPMSNREMADIAYLSPCHFNRVFHQVTGIPPSQFHGALRLQRAKQLLIATDLCVTEICFEVGYNSLGTFITRFNELVGLSPNAFRRFARRLAPMRLADLLPLLQAAPGPVRDGGASVRGTIRSAEPFDGLTFVALFRRAIPEGLPIACALAAGTQDYMLPLPGNGRWYVFSVGALWTSSIAELLTLDGLPRGRSGPILADGSQVLGEGSIELGWPNLLHPPVLINLPMLITRFLGGEAASPQPRAIRVSCKGKAMDQSGRRIDRERLVKVASVQQ